MRIFLSCFFTLNFLLIIFLAGCQYPKQKEEMIPAIIEGAIYVVGNEPFTELALQTKEGKVYTLRGDSLLELKGLQGQWVKLEGDIIKDQLFLYSPEGFFVTGYACKSAGEGTDE